MDFKDVFFYILDELYCIVDCTNACCCIIYLQRKLYVVNFNVSSTKDNAHAKLSRYV